MATKTSMVIKSVDSEGNEISKSITNVSPDASPVALKTFAQKLTGLTENTFSEAIRVEQLNVTGATKTTPTIFVSAGGMKCASDPVTLTLEYPGPARAVKLSGKIYAGCSVVTRDGKTLKFDTDPENPMYFAPAGEQKTFYEGEMTITLPANDYYNEASVKFIWSGAPVAEAIVDINKEM